MTAEIEEAKRTASQKAYKKIAAACNDLAADGLPAAAIDNAVLTILILRLNKLDPDSAAQFLRNIATWMAGDGGAVSYDA